MSPPLWNLIERSQVRQRLLDIFRQGQIAKNDSSLASIQLQAGVGWRYAQGFAMSLLLHIVRNQSVIAFGRILREIAPGSPCNPTQESSVSIGKIQLDVRRPIQPPGDRFGQRPEDQDWQSPWQR